MEVVLFIIGLLLCLCLIWIPQYFLTGDGPCHMANATILKHLWTDDNREFYLRFYQYNMYPDPNWFTDVFLAVLLFVFPVILAEKVALTTYLLLFLWSARGLMQKAAPRSGLWTLVLFLPAVHIMLTFGFYNFCFSIAFFFLLLLAWLQLLSSAKTKWVILFPVLLTLLYFTHPVSFAMGGTACFFVWIAHIRNYNAKGGRKPLSALVILVLSGLPLCLLFLAFANRQGGVEGIPLTLDPGRFFDLLKFRFLINYSSAEEPLLAFAGFIFCFTTVLAIVVMMVRRLPVPTHGFLLLLLFAIVVFATFSDDALGGGLVIPRIGLYVILIAGICVAMSQLPNWFHASVALLLYAFFFALFVIRMAMVMKVSAKVTDHMSVAAFIKPGSFVLPLNFATYGKAEDGGLLCDRNNVFAHEAQYLACGSRLIVADNYEANTTYFPLQWREQLNPYTKLRTWGGLEANPPGAAMQRYKDSTGVQVDYVLMLNYDPAIRNDMAYKDTGDELDTTYHEIYRSPMGEAVLLQRNR